MERYINFLKQNRVILRLSSVQLITYFGAWFSNVAIYTLLIDLKASPLTISLIAVAHFLPAVVQAPFIGVFIDKLNTKKLMSILILVQVMATFCLLFINSIDLITILFILIFIKMGSASFYYTAEMSLLPKLLNGDDLKNANELHSMIWSFSYIGGMALGGLAVYYLGTKEAIIIDGLLFLIAFFILKATNFNLNLAKNSDENFIKAFKDGLIYIKENKRLINLILLHAFIALTTFETVVTVLTDIKYKELIASSLSIGFIHSTRALALVLGPLYLGKIVNEQNLYKLFIAQGIGIYIWGALIDNFYLSFIGIFLTGFFTSTIWSYTITLIQREVKSEYFGRVMSYNDMLFMVSCALVSLLTGNLISFGIDIKVIFFLLGSGFILIGFFYKKGNF